MSKHESILFFYNQEEVSKRPARRAKKKLSESLLNSLGKNQKLNAGEGSQSLAARLAEMTSTNSATSMRSSQNASRANNRGNVYTDTRLQALRFLTEDMIRELEEKLFMFAEVGVRPNLPGPVIYEWHSDWTDLTEKCSYENFPQWHTKNGRESAQKKMSDSKSETRKDKSSLSRLDDSNNPTDSSLDMARKDSLTRNSKSIQINPVNQVKIVRQSSKLSSISEKNSAIPPGSAGGEATASATARGSKNHQIPRRSSIKNVSPVSGQKRTDINSRLIQNASTSTGCLVNYQLSSKQFREKGWTVIDIDLEDKIIDNERRIVTSLKNSLKSIEEVRIYNERYGLIKPCKIRFYGDHKKEAIEKYKSSSMRPKKSIFAMSISRSEIPKPLDLTFMLEAISNPNLNGLALGAPLGLNKGFGFNSILNDKQLNIPKPPPLLNTLTNDGTTCIYYTNGQLAIVLSNVYGYFIENSGASSGTLNNNEASFAKTPSVHNNLASMNGSFTASNSITGTAPTNTTATATGGVAGATGTGTGASANSPNLIAQNIRNSYTTIIYDMVRKEAKSGKNSLGVRHESIDLAEEYAESLTARKGSIFTKNGKNIKFLSEQRLMAVISPLGYCVVYRTNGSPKFVCTEYGGCLCNKNGAVTFQWKWDELRYTDYEKFKNELSLDLNKYIRLEYKNPSNIRLKFSCEKEVMEFDLGCPKEYQNRLHDLLNRTVCEFPFNSKIGQIKLSPTAKGQTLIGYKQYHSQQQQQASQSVLKSSIYLGKEYQDSNNKIDKLLETTVSFKDVPVLKDLLTTQKKIRSILEDWLAHCRSSLSILEPDMYIIPDLPIKHKVTRLNENHSDFDKIVFHRRKSKSAENLSFLNRFNLNNSFTFSSTDSGRTQNNTKKTFFINQFNSSSNNNNNNDYYIINASANNFLLDDKRSKSAFITRKAAKSFKYLELMSKLKEFKSQQTQNSQPEPQNSSRTVTNHFGINTKLSKSNQNLSSMSKSAIWSNADLNKAKASSSKRVLSSAIYSNKRGVASLYRMSTESNFNDYTSRSSRFFSNDDLNLMCPVSLHQKLAFERFDIDCKCRKQNVPLISDVEFDYFLRLVPLDQIIVVVITDSQNMPTNVQLIVSELYELGNKTRIQPCKESIRDEFRYLFYDIRCAAENSDHTNPILVSRHNVGPGMVLIYKASKLVFCDHIFNGYGYSQQDFVKQLQKSKEDAKLGKFLPYNFHFTHPVGKVGRRTPWGGQIGGVEDLDDSSQNVSNLNEFGSIEDLDNNTNTNTNSHTNTSAITSLRTGKQITSNLIVPKLIITSSSNKSSNQINLPKINKPTLQV